MAPRRACDERVVEDADRADRGWPHRLQVAPSSPMSPERGLVSGDAEFDVLSGGLSRASAGWSRVSSANQSTRSVGDHTPTLFTQPPRFVDWS